ncbi:MAG: type 4a pilus biogenesis protein PilO [Oceanicaulis sp.]|jgi:type IV pilus assembly protein PilO|nr:type 4a pilus biogenesis protein PilO [Oceanicaulis sp.]
MAIDLNEKPWYVAAIVGLVLAVAMFVVMQMYVFKPLQEEKVAIEEDIFELEREIEKGRQAERDLPRLMEDIENYEQELDRLTRILPTRRETPDLIKRLKQLTERGSFQMLKFIPGAPNDQKIYIEWPIDVELVGTYHELGLFFDRLAQFPRIINVDNLVVRPNANRGRSAGPHTIQASFTQRTYVYKDPNPTPSGGGGQ